MHVVYHPDVNQQVITLSESESTHAIKVLRMQVGEKLIVLDGKGGQYDCELITEHAKRAEVNVINKNHIPQRGFGIHIAIAPTKMNDRMEWFLEKVTELGVESITPVICARSERKTVNAERFQKVLIAAMKQSMNTWLPVLNHEIKFADYLKANPSGFIAHCMEGDKIHLKDAESENAVYHVLVGPEGDFTPEEVHEALSKEWKAVTLATNRLRTETAGMAACHIINLKHE